MVDFDLTKVQLLYSTGRHLQANSDSQIIVSNTDLAKISSKTTNYHMDNYIAIAQLYEMENEYSYEDLLYFLSPLFDNKLDWLYTEPQDIWNYLERYQYPFSNHNYTKQTLCFSGSFDMQSMNHLLTTLTDRMHEMTTLRVWDSNLSVPFFKLVTTLGWRFNRIELTGCLISNELTAKMTQLDLRGLKRLQINSDPINNKGFSELLSLKLPSLQALEISNTDITNDCLRLLKRKPFARLNSFSVAHQKHFQYNTMFRQGLVFGFMDSSSEYVSIGVRGCQSFIYPQYFAKITIGSGRRKYLFLNGTGFGTESKCLMVSKRTMDVLNEGIKIKEF